MRDVVVIGGGLTGLAAAYELEQHNVNYTLIEVKPRLGGSIDSVSENGFTFDTTAMTHTIRDVTAFSDYLAQLNIQEATHTPPHTASNTVAFNTGNRVLVDALADKITAPIMFRMAVSTLGSYGHIHSEPSHYAICMENGMVLDARALIIAAPARHSERMLHTLIPEAAYRLRDYRYQQVAYISVGYQTSDGPFATEVDPDYPVMTITALTNSERMPTDTTVLQAALRYELDHGIPQDAVGEMAALMGWPLNPLADHIGLWMDGETVMWRDPAHVDRLGAVQALLPDTVALCGSDYIPMNTPPRLDERVTQGVMAAQKIMNAL